MRQLTLEVGGEIDEPSGCSFTVTGRVASTQAQLNMDDAAKIVLMDEHGVVLVEADAFVKRVQFDKHERAGEQPWVERVHRLKVV
jgi:hypothetical protein